MRQITQLEEKRLLSNQKVAAPHGLKCAAIDWKIESENIVKTDLKSNIGNAEMSLRLVKILDKRLANDDYLLFTKALHSRLPSCSTSLLGADHYDRSRN
jgi:hypothetical protein